MGAEGELKFICDEQLGKLARWLKIIGQDVFYQNRLSDERLIELAQKEGRLILTRDTRLVPKLEKLGLDYFFPLENYPALQLKEVVVQFQDRLKIRIFTRCVDCNIELKEISRDEVKERVPPFVFRTQNQFRICPGCQKIFWRGTHRPQVDLQLRSVLGEWYDKLREEVWSD